MFVPLRCAQRALPLAAGLALIFPSWAAVSVTDVSVAQSGNSLTLSYRLNEAATSVSVVVGGQSYTGPTARGLNSVALPISAIGQSATITATAPPENGTGGAVVLIPFTQDPAASNYDGIAWVKRLTSPYYGHIYTVSGRAQTTKKLVAWAADGTKIAEKDLTLGGTVTSGSWPFGVALSQDDPNDFVYIANRSNRNIYKFAPGDLALQRTIPWTPVTTANSYPGMSITKNNSPSTTTPWSIYLGGNRDGTVLHFWYDGDVTVEGAPETPTAASITPSNTEGLVYSVAVDPTNQVLFKAQTHGTGVAPISEDDANFPGTPACIQKWTSSSQGDSWTLDTTWGTNFRNDIGADAAASALGVALDGGFDAANLAASKVWVCVTTVSPATVNKLYHVRADDGHIIAADTIDLRQITVPTDTQAIADLPAHFIDVSPRGNIALQVGQASDAGHAFYWGVLAPNTTSPSTAEVTTVLEPPLAVSAAVNHPTVGNTGAGTATFTVTVSDPKGQAGSATVTADLTQIGGSASAALTKASESDDHKTATFTLTVNILTSTPLGSFDLPFKATIGTTSVTATTNLGVYAAYVPSWQATVDGAVASSPAGNGNVAYIGTAAGSVYAMTASSGAAVTSFGSGGKVSLGEPVSGFITHAFGRLYVPGSNHVFCLNSGTGALIGTSAAIPSPSSVLALADDPTAVYVGGGDNKVHKLRSTTLVELAASADLGAAVHDPAVGLSTDAGDVTTNVIIAGTEPVAGSGKIVMLKASDLSEAFAPILDPKGAVKSRPAFSVVSGARPHAFGVGGASGLWGINADTGTLMAQEGSTSYWATDPGENGNPYGTPNPVDANVAAGQVGDPLAGGFVYATRGDANSGGALNILNGNTGMRVSYGGLPVPLTVPGSGFAAGSGPLYMRGRLPDDSTDAAYVYIGSDNVDQRFFAIDTLPQDYTYTATAPKKHIFDARDSNTFGTSYAAGGFASTPAMAADTVVVGSSASRVYGFPSLMAGLTYVSGVVPANGAVGVSTSTSISLTYTKDISTATIDETTVRLIDDTGTPVDAPPLLQADNTTIIMTPAAPLAANKTYSVVASLSGVQPFSSSFYTGIPAVVKGDVNGDGAFTAQDVKEALRMAGGLSSATDKAIQALSKTKPYSITVQDALFLDRVLNGLASF